MVQLYHRVVLSDPALAVLINHPNADEGFLATTLYPKPNTSTLLLSSNTLTNLFFRAVVERYPVGAEILPLASDVVYMLLDYLLKPAHCATVVEHLLLLIEDPKMPPDVILFVQSGSIRILLERLNKPDHGVTLPATTMARLMAMNSYPLSRALLSIINGRTPFPRPHR